MAEPITQLYERLKQAGYISPIPALPVDVRAKWYDPNKVCPYHSGTKGHTTEVCRALKDKVQMLIDTKTIQLKDPTPNVANNPLPNHQVNWWKLVISGIGKNLSGPSKQKKPCLPLPKDH